MGCWTGLYCLDCQCWWGTRRHIGGIAERLRVTPIVHESSRRSIYRKDQKNWSRVFLTGFTLITNLHRKVIIFKTSIGSSLRIPSLGGFIFNSNYIKIPNYVGGLGKLLAPYLRKLFYARAKASPRFLGALSKNIVITLKKKKLERRWAGGWRETLTLNILRKKKCNLILSILKLIILSHSLIFSKMFYSASEFQTLLHGVHCKKWLI